MDRRLVDQLVNSEVVSRAVLQRYILRATKNKSTILSELFQDDVSEQSILEALATCYGYQTLDLSAVNPEARALSMVAGLTAEKSQLLPIAVNLDALSVVVSDPERAQELLATLKLATGNPPLIFIAEQSKLRKAIRHFYFKEPWPERNKAEDPFSEEILLEHISPPEAVSPKKSRPTPARPITAPVGLQPDKTNASPRVEPINQALNDFDAFLETSSAGGGFSSDDEWETEYYKNQSSFGNSAFGNASLGSSSPGGSGLGTFGFGSQLENPKDDQGFDLFEVSEIQLTVQELVDRHEAQIASLRQELKAQRDVVSVLVEMLQEARLLNRKELSKRVQARREQ